MEKLDFLTEKENEAKNKFLEKFNIEKINEIKDDKLPYKIYGNKENDSMAYNVEFVLNNDFGNMSGTAKNITYPIYLKKENNTWKKENSSIQFEEATRISKETKDSINLIDNLIKNNKFDDLFKLLNNKKHIFEFRLMHKYLCVVYPTLFLHWHIKEKFKKYMKILKLDDYNNIVVVEKYFWDKYKNNIEDLNMKKVTEELEQKVKENESKERNNQNEEKEIEDWYPSIDEYNPNISADRWIELLKDRTIFDNDSLVVMKRIKNCGGIASCKQLSDKYGLKIIDYNRISSSLAKRVYKTTNCKLMYRQDTKNPIWYFILYVGKYDENNIYFWKLRNELSVALDKIDLSEVQLYEQGYGMSENNQPLNQILYGPPGTGKTYNTIIKAMEIIGTIKINYDKEHNVLNYEELQEEFNKLKQSKQIEFITFHQSYSYEEFIEGIKPVINKKDNNNDIKYEYKKGIFKELCLRAEKDKGNNYVIVIDEINRGNISKIFGELITLIEENKRIGNKHELKLTLPYSKESLGIPNNLYIIGTMNTSDRSIASVDIALRRRFKFIEMMPKENLITDISLGNDKTFIDIFKALNEKIIILLDRDHQIGHSYFMSNKVSKLEDLKNVWFNEILPLLNEYFYNDWEKLQALLGEASKNNDSFIVVKETKLPFYNYDIEDKVYDFIDKKYMSGMSNDDNFKSALLKIIQEPKQKEIDEQ